MALIATVYFTGKHSMPGQGGMFRLATLLFFTVIPVFIIGPVAGVYTDRWNRRHTMIWSDIIRGGLVLLIPFILIHTRLVFPIYIIVFFIFSVTRFFLPAKLSIIPDLVPKNDILLANSLITTSRLISTVLGLGLGGFIVDMVGAKTGFYIDSITYFLSASAIVLIHITIHNVKPRQSILTQTRHINQIEKNVFYDISRSIKYIFSHKQIPFALETFFVLMSIAGSISVIFIDFNLKNFITPPQSVERLARIIGFGQLGFIIVFTGAGAFIGTLLFGKWGRQFIKERAISIGFIFSGLFLFLFSYCTEMFKSFWLTSALSFLLGLTLAPVMALANTLLHEVTRDEMRGRVFSTLEIVINLAFLIFMYLSIFLVTYLKFPEAHILGIAGIIVCIYGIWKRGKLQGYKPISYEI